MSKWWLVGMMLGLALVQGYFLSALSGGQIVINFVLVTAIFICLRRSIKLTVVLAVWGGFWLDVAAGNYFGVRMLLLAGLVVGVDLLRRGGLDFNRRSVLLPSVAIAAYLYDFVLLALFWFSSRHFSWDAVLLRRWSLGVLLTVILAAVVQSRLKAPPDQALSGLISRL